MQLMFWVFHVGEQFLAKMEVSILYCWYFHYLQGFIVVKVWVNDIQCPFLN